MSSIGTERDSARDSNSWVRKYTDKGVRGLESLVTGTPSDSLSKVKSQSSVRLTTFSGSVATDGQKGDASWAFAGRPAPAITALGGLTRA